MTSPIARDARAGDVAAVAAPHPLAFSDAGSHPRMADPADAPPTSFRSRPRETTRRSTT